MVLWILQEVDVLHSMVGNAVKSGFRESGSTNHVEKSCLPPSQHVNNVIYYELKTPISGFFCKR